MVSLEIWEATSQSLRNPALKPKHDHVGHVDWPSWFQIFLISTLPILTYPYRLSDHPPSNASPSEAAN
jgi:hypothetical protein